MLTHFKNAVCEKNICFGLELASVDMTVAVGRLHVWKWRCWLIEAHLSSLAYMAVEAWQTQGAGFQYCKSAVIYYLDWFVSEEGEGKKEESRKK